MTGVLRFEVALPYRELSSNGGHGHWAAEARARSMYRAEVALVAGSAAINQRWDRPAVARVSLLFGIKGGRSVQRYQPRDLANAVAAWKAGYDGLVDAGVLVDDSRQHMEVGEVLITAKNGPWVRVLVEAI